MKKQIFGSDTNRHRERKRERERERERVRNYIKRNIFTQTHTQWSCTYIYYYETEGSSFRTDNSWERERKVYGNQVEREREIVFAFEGIVLLYFN